MQSKSDETTEVLFSRALENLRDGIDDTAAIHFEYAVYLRGKGDTESSLQHFVTAERITTIFHYVPVNKSIRETSQAMIKLINSGSPVGMRCERERAREERKEQLAERKLDKKSTGTGSCGSIRKENSNRIKTSRGNRRGRDRTRDRSPSPPPPPIHP